MAFTFTLSTESVNSYGFITKTDGIDLSTFTQNPVMLFDHNTSLVIGRWANIRKEGTQLLADAEFDDQDPFAQQIKSKVAQGFLKSASIGYHCNWDTIRKDGQAGAPVIMDSTLLEASIVAIPSNQEAQVHLSQDQQNRFQMYQDSQMLSEKDKQNAALTAEVLQLKATIKEMQQAEDKRLAEQKAQFLQDAVAAHQITEQEASILAELSTEKLRDFLAQRKPRPASIMAQIQAHQHPQQTLSFSQLSKTDPQQLQTIKENNPSLYAYLYQQEFGKQPH